MSIYEFEKKIKNNNKKIAIVLNFLKDWLKEIKKNMSFILKNKNWKNQISIELDKRENNLK